MNTDITAIILTKNESVNIVRCIESLSGLAQRIVVVDSGSEDHTVELAAQLGAEIYRHPFRHYADQFNWALDHTDIQTTWVYRIDADEAVPEDLRQEILTECQAHREDDVNGFLMKHKLYFLGRYLTHGGAYPFVKMTVFKPAYGRFEDRAMGEHVVLQSGRHILLRHDCLHYDCKNLTAFLEKHNAYADREVVDYFSAQTEQGDVYRQAARSRQLRDRLYYRLPKFFRAKVYYWYRYYGKLGFLDGTPGKIYALLQGYCYRVMVDAKIYEAEVQRRAGKP